MSARRRRKAKGGRSASRPRRKIRWGAVVAILAGVGVAVGVALRDRSPEADPPPLAVTEVREGGVTVAVLDEVALTNWCRRHDLPDPPGVREVEPDFAAIFLQALESVAVERSAEAFGTVGMLCESMESHGVAEEYFARAEGEDPLDPRWPYYLGCLFQVTGRNDEARAALERSRERDAAYPMLHGRLGQLALEAGRLDEADAHFDEYERLRPDDGFGRLGKARVSMRRGEPETALANLEAAGQRGMRDFQFLRTLGSVYAALGREDDARQAFAASDGLPQGLWYRIRDPRDQALHEVGSPVAALQSEFERRGSSGDWAALADLAERILERRPADVRTMGNLVGLYRKLERYDDAHAMLDRAFATGGDELRLNLLRSETYLAAGEYAAAREAADRARTLEKESPRVWSLLGRALLMEGRTADAEAAMLRSLALAPDDVSNLLVLGEVRRIAGDPEGAAAAYRDVLKLEDNLVARQRLDQIVTSE